jgi:hypothetical protein
MNNLELQGWEQRVHEGWKSFGRQIKGALKLFFA